MSEASSLVKQLRQGTLTPADFNALPSRIWALPVQIRQAGVSQESTLIFEALKYCSWSWLQAVSFTKLKQVSLSLASTCLETALHYYRCPSVLIQLLAQVENLTSEIVLLALTPLSDHAYFLNTAQPHPTYHNFLELLFLHPSLPFIIDDPIVILDQALQPVNTSLLLLAVEHGYDPVFIDKLTTPATVDFVASDRKLPLLVEIANACRPEIVALFLQTTVQAQGLEQALALACTKGRHQGIIFLLLHCGLPLKLDRPLGPCRTTILMREVYWNDRPGVVQQLLHAGAARSVRNCYGNTALGVAIAMGRSLNLVRLLTSPASILVKNHNGQTPYMLEMAYNNRVVVLHFLALQGGGLT